MNSFLVQLSREWSLQAVFIVLMVSIVFYEFRYKIIPNAITIPGFFVGIILSVSMGHGIHVPVLGACVGSGLFLLIGMMGSFVFKKNGAIGFGLVKMTGMIGCFLGMEKTMVAIVIGSALGAVSGMIQLRLGTMNKRDPMEFGPYLALAGILSSLFPFADWYFRLLDAMLQR